MNIIDWYIMNHGLNKKIDRGFILYGASSVGKRMALLLCDLGLSDKVLAVVDSDERKWGGDLLQHKISSPNFINSISDNAIIVITSTYLNEIYEYLQEKVKCSNEICSAFSLSHAFHYDIMNNKSYYIETIMQQNYKKKYELWKNVFKSQILLGQQGCFIYMIEYIMRNPESIFLNALPKTGNTSLNVSLEEDKKYNVLCTYHASYYDECTYMHLKKIVQCFNKNKIKIITGIREPIERIISNKWQVIDSPDLNNDRCVTTLIDENYHYFIDDLISSTKLTGMSFSARNFFYADCINWFKDHIEKPFGIDVFAYPFDKDKGYSIIRENNISIFLYRLDKLSELEKEIGQFVGDNSFKLKKANEASEKKYAFAYKEYLQNIKINKDFFNTLVNSRGMTHFYTDEECKKYKNKWNDRLV